MPDPLQYWQRNKRCFLKGLFLKDQEKDNDLSAKEQDFTVKNKQKNQTDITDTNYRKKWK